MLVQRTLKIDIYQAIMLLALICMSGLFVGVEEISLFKTGGLSAEEANVPFIEEGQKPPYTISSRARIIRLQNGRSFVRVHGENNQVRAWLIRSKSIEGHTIM